ncbi:DEAD/DEAH box helicase [Burkholderia pseudomallei]|uniref:DEAD/DEAH box helicase n=1 Tax=Burkholderia pseudomallei TaxID=28450 RepID=UPI00201A23BB|nr:DEAD/DEAH box helicase [Burkholderia pseudomallei]MCL4670789.1 ATP-dependent helicase [Burkholderia pseudomallei]
MTDFVHIQYAQSGASQTINEMGMRAMQARAFDERGSQYLLVKAPPASGKSRALMFIALDKLMRQGLRKVIVAVPERSIGASFKSTPLSRDGFFADWVVEQEWNLTLSGGAQKTKAFADFMAGEATTLVCTHATLRFAFEQLGAAAFDRCLLAVDEFHHASADENSRLGELVRALMERDQAHIVAMTGSYFRGDAAPVLRPEDEARFNRVTYTYYEQLNGYKDLKTLGIGYHFYRGRYIDAINEILDPAKKTIVHIPSVQSAESTSDKYNEVDRILDHIGTVIGRDETTGFHQVQRPTGEVVKVADLVDDGPGRERVMAALREALDRDAVDIIIALGMAKEGFDWIWCEHALTVGYRGSLTEVVQIIGRATRDAPGKEHAQFTNLIAEPDASEERVVEAVNNMLKAIACSLLMEQVLAPNFKFRAKEGGDEIDGSHREVDIVYDGGESIIAINGFAEPSTERARQIIETDLADLTAAIFQDERVLRASMNPEEVAPEVINQVYIPRVIQTKYPDLTEQELEEVRQAVVAGGVFKSPEVSLRVDGGLLGEGGITPGSGEQQTTENQDVRGGTRFIRMANRLINIDELTIDLIDQINPFQRAYEILSKTVSADVLKTIHGAVALTKIAMTEEEAVALYPRIKSFTADRGHEPSLGSANPLERRMAEALAWLREAKRKRMSTGAIGMAADAASGAE